MKLAEAEAAVRGRGFGGDVVWLKGMAQQGRSYRVR